MRRRFSPIIVVALLACLGQAQAQAADNHPDLLQRAINLSSKNPKAAERQLLGLSRPSAKAYLAYLYMSQAVTVPNAAKRIDTLMNAAISKASTMDNLGDIKAGAHYHYTDMAMLLRHLRFITDADGGPTIPSSMFEMFPAQAFEAFGPYWGSTRDGFLSVDVQKKDEVGNIPAVAAYLSTLELMFGNPSSNCSGSIRNRFYRLQALGSMEASLAPQLFVETAKDPDTAVTYLQLERFLQTWANAELWNNQTYQTLVRQSKAAEAPLAALYRQHFKMSQSKSAECAKAALCGLRLAYFDSYSQSDVSDTRGTIAYPIFSRRALTLTDMQQQLGDKDLSKENLVQALRLSILNGADIQVIDWLIAHGAPVSGGTESPLFTAVLRPEVVSALLKAGANVNETNAIGKTTLIQAAQFNATDTIKLLLSSGADVKHSMVATDSKEASDANATCDFNYTIGSRTALMYAAAFSDYPTIMELLKSGADKNAVDSKGDKSVKYLSWNTKLSKEDKAKLVQTLSH